MNRKLLKGALFACLLGLASSLPHAGTAHAEPVRVADDVKVQVNTDIVPFQDNQATPFVDETHLVQVPVRAVADHLGLTTEWEQAEGNIRLTLKNDDTTVSFTTGSDEVIVNGEPLDNSYKASLIDGRAYVPIRLFSDAFSILRQWDNKNRIAILSTDGEYKAPAWYRGSSYKQGININATAYTTELSYTKVLDAKATAYTAAPSENGGWAGKDFMGNALKLGTIAVDPDIIPLGSKVYIEGYSHNGLPAQGMYGTATDIGGSVKGNRIDIFVPQPRSEALKFGIQNVKVYVLK